MWRSATHQNKTDGKEDAVFEGVDRCVFQGGLVLAQVRAQTQKARAKRKRGRGGAGQAAREDGDVGWEFGPRRIPAPVAGWGQGHRTASGSRQGPASGATTNVRIEVLDHVPRKNSARSRRPEARRSATARPSEPRRAVQATLSMSRRGPAPARCQTRHGRKIETCEASARARKHELARSSTGPEIMRLEKAGPRGRAMSKSCCRSSGLICPRAW